MDKLFKGAVDTLPAAKEIIEVQEVLPLPEPESNGYGKDIGIVIVGIIVAASLYKLWLKYGKK
tara:strand:- start:395 stop:583 length:189 start_codon:yes stop_codon:yes gene_type:complete